jgi:hypothetical protein
MMPPTRANDYDGQPRLFPSEHVTRLTMLIWARCVIVGQGDHHEDQRDDQRSYRRCRKRPLFVRGPSRPVRGSRLIWIQVHAPQPARHQYGGGVTYPGG